MVTALEESTLIEPQAVSTEPTIITVPRGRISFEEAAMAEVSAEVAEFREILVQQSVLKARAKGSLVVSLPDARAARYDLGFQPPRRVFSTSAIGVGSLVLGAVLNDLVSALSQDWLVPAAIIGALLLCYGVIREHF